ncbi:DUF3899 domain-containing protein [Staphylococcus devriesei]|uniref:DUF3899 domain-containing protein n=1 Tax=Staphylococcus devriesei TaxID=586733 RepID=UPI000E6A4F30|nr:DUF3899 domain-containing protein [Staphylococcus devriesei]RIL72390.1 DUF3899 domain-containing protein [Staphylococcus devriesei]
MKNLKNWIIWFSLTPLLTLIVWVLFTPHTLISFLDVLFYISLIIFIVVFLILLVQEGVFDATSYGFRRIRYQMSSRAKKKTMEHDEFFNPQQAKREYYIVESWVVPALLCNALFFLLTIVVSLNL